MSNPSEPSSAHPSAQPQPSGDAHLRAGLQALAQKRYSAAIAAFEAVSAANASSNQRLQARIGLVKAYSKLGRWQTAHALWQPLAHHRNPQVQAWSQRWLATAAVHLAQPQPEQPLAKAGQTSEVSDRSGFTPLAPAAASSASGSLLPAQAAPNSPQAKSQPAGKSAQGFDSVAKPESQLGASLGSAEPTLVPKSLESVSDLAPKSAPESASELASKLAPESDQAPIPAGSLFHYQQLNSKTGAAPNLPTPEGSNTLAQDLPQNLSQDPPQAATAAAKSAPRIRPKPLSPLKLWSVMGLSAIALQATLYWLAAQLQGLINELFQQLHQLTVLIPPVYLDYRLGLIVGLLLLSLLLVSPWAMDFLLSQLYGQRGLSTQRLKADFPETLRTLRRASQQQGWPLAELRLLPQPEPLCFSYGWHPSNVRLVVSQGLLEQLEDSELAALCAYETGHLQLGELPLMSALGLLLFVIHQGYWQSARWGDRQRLGWVRIGAGLAASACYSLFWGLRLLGLWLSRLRSDYCDRVALDLIQDPSHYAQGLLKLAGAMAAQAQQQRYTSPLLEGLDLLMPLSHLSSLSLGSCLEGSNSTLEALTAWDRQNPYRRWLAWKLPQALLGERLALIAAAGGDFGLPAEGQSSSAGLSAGRPSRLHLPTLLAQGAPLAGLVIGLAVAMLLWFIGGVTQAFDGWLLSWLYGDSSVLKAMALLGFGIGLMLRINPLFPDIKGNRTPNPTVSSLLENPLALPADSQPVQLQGQLLGRPGLANWLCQDVLLQTSTGLVRLQVLSALGPWGNLLTSGSKPQFWRDRDAIVVGWVRRGGLVYLDVDRWQIGGKTWEIANAPLWLTLISLAACLWSVVILFRGY